jgi:hypothetical protein
MQRVRPGRTLVTKAISATRDSTGSGKQPSRKRPEVAAIDTIQKRLRLESVQRSNPPQHYRRHLRLRRPSSCAALQQHVRCANWAGGAVPPNISTAAYDNRKLAHAPVLVHAMDMASWN